MLTILLVCFTMFAVYYLPGRFVFDLLASKHEPEEKMACSLGLGIVLVNTIVIFGVGVVGLWAKVYVTREILWCTSLVLIAVGFFLRRRRKLTLSRPTRTQIFLWIFSIVGFSFFFVHYDPDILREDACNLRLTAIMLDDVWRPELLRLNNADESLSPYQADPISGVPKGRNGFLTGWDGQPLGASMLIAPFLALFGGLGLRLVYALSGLLLPGLGFGLGRYVIGGKWAPWVVAFFLTFSPYAIETRTFDENHLANIFGSLALMMLLRPAPAPILAGMAASLFLAIRHVEILVVPAIWYYLVKTTERKHAATTFTLSLIIFLLPEIVMHVLFMTEMNGTLLESTFERPLVQHSLFGITFDSRMLLNFPFVPAPLRSPFHAFPPLIAYPLDFVRRFGVILVVSMLIGMARSIFRPQGILLLSWALPLMGILMVQSNWVEENKMGIPCTALPTFVLASVAGIAYLLDSRISLVRRGCIAFCSSVIVLAGALALRTVDAPRDDRVYEYPVEYVEPSLIGDLVVSAVETSDYVEWDRSRYTVNALPSFTPDHEWDMRLIKLDIKRAIEDIKKPHLSDFRRPMPDFLRQVHGGFGLALNPLSLLSVLESGDFEPGLPPIDFGGPTEQSIAVDLLLQNPPLLARDPLVPKYETPKQAIDCRGPTVVAVSSLHVPWGGDHKQSIVIARDKFDRVIIFIAPGPIVDQAVPGWLSLQRLTSEDVDNERLTLLLPKNTVLRFIEMRSYQPPRWYSRYAIIEDDRIWFTNPIAFSPS